MGFFERLRNLFRGGEASQEQRGGFFERARQRRIERQARRSQKIIEKLEKQQRKEEERQKKEADQRKKEEAYKKSAETFKERWGFSSQAYDDFIQFVSSVPDEMKEVIQVGQAVLVPFGRQGLINAFVVGFSDYVPEDIRVKKINRILDETPLFSLKYLKLLFYQIALNNHLQQL